MTFSTGDSFPSGAICFQNACADGSLLCIAALIAILISFFTSCSVVLFAFATSLMMFFNILPLMSYSNRLSLIVIVMSHLYCRSPAIFVDGINKFPVKKESSLFRRTFVIYGVICFECFKRVSITSYSLLLSSGASLASFSFRMEFLTV